MLKTGTVPRVRYAAGRRRASSQVGGSSSTVSGSETARIGSTPSMVTDLGRLQERRAGIEVGLRDASRCVAGRQVAPHRRQRRTSARDGRSPGRQGDGQEWVTAGTPSSVGDAGARRTPPPRSPPGRATRSARTRSAAVRRSWPRVREQRVAPGRRRARGRAATIRSSRPGPISTGSSSYLATCASWSAPLATRTSCPASACGQGEREYRVEMAPTREGGDQHPHPGMIALVGRGIAGIAG